MNITANHIASKRVIGKLKGKDVHELLTTGGLHIVAVSEGGKTRVLGTGPHRGVARYIAEKNEPSLIITELSKSDALDPVTLMNEVPKYEALTKHMQSLGA